MEVLQTSPLILIINSFNREIIKSDSYDNAILSMSIAFALSILWIIIHVAFYDAIFPTQSSYSKIWNAMNSAIIFGTFVYSTHLRINVVTTLTHKALCEFFLIGTLFNIALFASIKIKRIYNRISGLESCYIKCSARYYYVPCRDTRILAVVSAIIFVTYYGAFYCTVAIIYESEIGDCDYKVYKYICQTAYIFVLTGILYLFVAFYNEEITMHCIITEGSRPSLYNLIKLLLGTQHKTDTVA